MVCVMAENAASPEQLGSSQLRTFRIRLWPFKVSVHESAPKELLCPVSKITEVYVPELMYVVPDATGETVMLSTQ